MTETFQAARQNLLNTRKTAQAVGDTIGESFALGYLGNVYERCGQYEDAGKLSRQALWLAQKAQSADASFRWQWQVGRILRHGSDLPAAVAAYRRAIDTLRPIRNDLAMGGGNRAASDGTFRETIGPVYYQLADLLFRESDRTGNAALLTEARDVVEQLKQAELEDYFQDACTSIAEQRTQSLEQIGRDAAVFYVIPLEDRTELLLTLPTGLKRYRIDVTSKQLDVQADSLSRLLRKSSTNEYLRPSQQLYKWLIEPVKDDLAAAGVKTIVFVPDGKLRTISMAALHDGKDFLISNYSVAVSPGLRLMETAGRDRSGTQVLLSGLSEERSVQRGARQVAIYPALEHVPEELRDVENVFTGQTKTLLNSQFSLSAVESEVNDNTYAVVHIASHGNFGGRARDTYLVAHGGEITLDDLQRLIQPSRFRNHPVELLTLSACQTARGDDRAALGLAGVAVKSGARSALATLWCVNDDAASKLVTHFYEKLQDPTVDTKAESLRLAQLKMIDEGYRHPYFWSPFLLIGNWK